ncbi:MAG TPA: acyltransferase [Spongiibacteraceae bacterium]|nr:acyltransferase [Spongiibacteraceae bacterium]
MQRRIADIELLRGVSIALVVLHQFKNVLIDGHSTALNKLFSFFDFWIGTDIFFAISGFVVARSLLTQLDLPCITHKQFFIDVAAFWLKRVWRLWPSAWLWLVLILVAVVYGNQSGSFGSFTANIEATAVAILQVANFRFADSLVQNFEYGASSVYWSLSQVEQFYVLLPILVFVLRHKLAAVLLVLLIAKAVLALLFPDFNSIILTMLLRADALLWGVLLAIWAGQPSYLVFEPTVFRHRLARWGLSGLLLICLGGLAANGSHVISNAFRFVLIGVVAAIPVFVASYDKSYLCATGWLQSLLMWVGSRSYGIYLIHVPVFLLTREIWFRLMPADTVFDGAFNIRFTLTAIPMLIVLSELNYRLLERPLRNRGKRIAEQFRAAHQESEQQQVAQ